MTEQSIGDPPIPIIYADSGDTGEKGLLSPVKTASSKIGAVDTEQLADNLSAPCRKFVNVFRAAQHASDGYEVDSFEVAVDVAARGEVRLVASASGELYGGVKPVFRRVPEEPRK